MSSDFVYLQLTEALYEYYCGFFTTLLPYLISHTLDFIHVIFNTPGTDKKNIVLFYFKVYKFVPNSVNTRVMTRDV